MSFYDRYAERCENSNVDPCSQAMADMLGVTKATITNWKTRGNTPSGDIVARAAQYFGCQIEYLLGIKETPSDSGERTDDDIKFALFGGDGEITDEMYEEVKRFAAYVKDREKKKG